MNRCFKPHLLHLKPQTTARHFAAAIACALFALSATPSAMAQQSAVMENAVARNFPASSQRGELTVTSTVEGTVGSTSYRLAPGLRIFNQQNQLVFAHSVVGKKLDVRYLVETSTGMLLTVWILTQNEIAKEPKKGWFQ